MLSFGEFEDVLFFLPNQQLSGHSKKIRDFTTAHLGTVTHSVSSETITDLLLYWEVYFWEVKSVTTISNLISHVDVHILLTQ